jgi:hypothetical protein
VDFTPSENYMSGFGKNIFKFLLICYGFSLISSMVFAEIPEQYVANYEIAENYDNIM